MRRHFWIVLLSSMDGVIPNALATGRSVKEPISCAEWSFVLWFLMALVRWSKMSKAVSVIPLECSLESK